MRFGLSALFIAIGGAAIVALWSSPASSTYVQTGRPYDITVIGNGWLYGTDSKTNKRKYFKSCSLSINRYSTLVGNVGDSEIEFEPHIPVIGSIENLRCSPDGKITVLLEDSPTPSHFGQLDLAVALSSAKSYVFEDEQLASAPVMYAPNSKTGYLQSGWLLQQESLLDRFKKVSFGELTILVVASGILVQLLRLTAARDHLQKALPAPRAPEH
jgi:flagellar basal body rod protein FlgG